MWGRNAAAWVIGAMLAWLLARVPPARLYPALLLIAPLIVLASLIGPGQSGVHRWIALGPFRWNAAFLCLPAATVAIAAMARSGSRLAWLSAAALQLALCFQPDASQATAFAAAMIVTVVTTKAAMATRLTASLAFAVGAIVACTRPDPLQPVPEVEGIIALAYAHSPVTAVISVAALAAVIASPPSLALAVYFLICAIAPLFGAFPVPLVGMGMSPILGFWLGYGVLTAAPRYTKSNHPFLA